MLGFPNAKINIGLYVTEKRSDGYHNIETIFAPINLKDAIEFYPDERETFALYGSKEVIPKATNLVWKAYQLLKERHSDIPNLSFQLLKGIPSGAGLGGGSADAAFCLKLLNDYYHLNHTSQELMDDALALGSDCPFFILNKPAFAKGRGELLTPIKLDLSKYKLVLINPHIHVGTKDAFANLLPRPANIDLQTIETLPINLWKDKIENHFEETIFKLYPEIGALRQALYNLGAIFSAMSGTGSTVYGIFDLNQNVDFGQLKGKDYFIYETTFL